jgi:predicted helicase
MFHDTRDRKWVAARAVPFDEQNITQIAYRPLDRRYLYNHRAYGDFLRPDLQEVWGNQNVGLYALPNGTGAGPAVWCHGLIPDYHAFRGSYGGYAFPLHDRRPNVNAPNISPMLTQSLSAAYGVPIAAENVFDAILCLLSASSYSLRFAEDLEDVFPHVPFPAQHAIFEDAVRVGREIRAIEIFTRQPNAAYLRREFVRVTTEPRGAVAPVNYEDGAITLCDNRTGRITGLPQAVWDFSVSGYRLVPRWLEARVGLPTDLALVQELRNICGRIAELIDLFVQADTVLQATLQETLTREVLGLVAAEQEPNDGRD